MTSLPIGWLVELTRPIAATVNAAIVKQSGFFHNHGPSVANAAQHSNPERPARKRNQVCPHDRTEMAAVSIVGNNGAPRQWAARADVTSVADRRYAFEQPAFDCYGTL